MINSEDTREGETVKQEEKRRQEETKEARLL